MVEKKLLFFLLLFSVVILTFFPHLQTKFTTNDDSYAALQANQSSRLASALKEATEQGRFQFAIGYLGAQLPYLFDSIWYYQAIRLGSILLNFWLYYLLVKNLSTSKELALLVTVLALAFLQNNWQHSLITAYPFLYHSGLSLFFLSILATLRGIEHGVYKYTILSAILFLAACLTYESFLPLFVLYPLLIVIRRSQDSPTDQAGVRTFHLMAPHLVVLCVYLATYIIFRSLFPGKNPGVHLGDLFSLKSFFSVVGQFVRSTLPGYFYINDPGSMVATFDGVTDDYPGWAALFKHLKGDWLLKGSLVALASGYLLRRGGTILTRHSFLITLIFGTGLMILPVIPLGLSPKYQEWVAQGILAYVPCYFAFFGTMVLVGSLLIGINQTIFSRKILHLVFIGVASGMVFVSSLATDFYNHYITLDQQLSQAKWKAFDLFLQTEEFNRIPDRSMVYAPTLWRYRGIVVNHPSYWSDYVRLKTNRNIKITSSQEEIQEVYNQNPSVKLYFFSIWQENKDLTQFLIFSEINKTNNPGLRPLSNTCNIFLLGRQRTYQIIGTLSPDEPKPKITIDGRSMNDLKANVYVGAVDTTLKKGGLRQSVMQSNAFFQLENISLSFFPVPLRLSDYRPHFKEGFYSEEGGGTGHTWYWSNGNAQVEIVNSRTKPGDVQLEFGLGTLEPRRVEIFFKGVFKTSCDLKSSEDRPVRLAIEVQPGPNILEFRTNRPAVRPRQGTDRRSLAFKVIDFHIAEVPAGKQKPVQTSRD